MSSGALKSSMEQANRSMAETLLDRGPDSGTVDHPLLSGPVTNLSSRTSVDHPEPKFKLVEIYNSVKGEGTQAGLPMTFVRFSKCNLACVWCDTPYERIAIEMTEGALLSHIFSQKPAWVVFTGGEPCLQLKASTVRPLKDAGIRTAIETNGMIWTEALPLIDYINISPKKGQFLDRRIADELTVQEVRYTLADRQKDLWHCMSGHDVSSWDNWKTAQDSPQGRKMLIGIATESITVSPLMDDPSPDPNFKSGDGFNEEHGKLNMASKAVCLNLVNRYRHHGARLSLQVHKFLGER